VRCTQSRGRADMKRREFIGLVSGAAAWPVTARAQQSGGLKRIGVLLPFFESDLQVKAELEFLREAIKSFGWQDDQNVKFEIRWLGGDAGRLHSVVGQLIKLPCDLIIPWSTPPTLAVRNETHTTPVLFMYVSDPVGDGIVASLARPGGNITGFTTVQVSLDGKLLELLREVAPQVVRISVIYNPKTVPGGGSHFLKQIEAAASAAITVSAAPVADDKDIASIFDGAATEPNIGIIVMSDSTTASHRMAIIDAAAQHGIPTIYPYPWAASEGGLIGYGMDVDDMLRRAAIYIDRILRGTRPDELPVQAPVKFKLAINVKTAKALGLTIPQTLLAQADELIE
jgi:putative tryptophan/tyrosine transport system substrate-binding protein